MAYRLATETGSLGDHRATFGCGPCRLAAVRRPLSGGLSLVPPTPRQPCRIVVTDDDPKLLAWVVSTLRDAGHCVFAAYDGDSALELSLLIPDLQLLITNTRLGTDSARELIRRVRQKKPELPILHLGDPLPDPEGLLEGVPSLREPFTSGELLAAVTPLLR